MLHNHDGEKYENNIKALAQATLDMMTEEDMCKACGIRDMATMFLYLSMMDEWRETKSMDEVKKEIDRIRKVAESKAAIVRAMETLDKEVVN